MSDFDIEVVGARRPQGPRRCSRLRAALGWLIRPRIKTWLVIGALGGMLIYGTPHVLVTYRCIKHGGTCQVFTECRYYGVQGWRYGAPDQGRCGFIRLIPTNWEKFHG